MEEFLRHSDLSAFSSPSKAFLGFILLISYICGTLGKMAIFKHMRNFKLSERPINVLILVDEIIYLVLITFTTLNLLIVLLLDQTPAHFIKHHLHLPIDKSVSIRIYFLN
jgi:hypothetical protein